MPPATISMAITTVLPSQFSKLYFFPLSSNTTSNTRTAIKFSYIHQPHLCQRRFFATPISSRGSARQKKRGASNAEPKVNPMSFKDAKVVLESREDNKIQVATLLRVDLNGVDTQKVFSKVLRDLNRTAPPVPGFRLQKGGKMSPVPQEFLLQMLGEDRVKGFVIQEIITSTTADFIEKENLKVKENKINTTQKEDELKKIFKPGDEFGFNVVLELGEPEPESETESEAEPETKSEPETETSDQSPV